MKTDRNEEDARREGREGRDDNPNVRGSRAWFEWEDARREQLRADGRETPDGTPPGCPPWA